ncbi:hypothetical protein T10_2414 [Trichinella papuae]|uniref:Uncharacterized protein n=1 Tax=Trichinella papuae TaxID=268474 RepID=A0A0V1MNZ3_9BILA|nr:hypothetical protein T10_2414 [Trichinella papuae]
MQTLIVENFAMKGREQKQNLLRVKMHSFKPAFLKHWDFQAVLLPGCCTRDLTVNNQLIRRNQCSVQY